MTILGQQEKVTYNGATSEAVIRKRSGNKINGPFSAISPLTNKKRTRLPMQADVFDLLDQAETKLFDVTQGNLKKSSEAAHNLVAQAL